MGFGRRKSRPSRQTIYARSGQISLGQGGPARPLLVGAIPAPGVPSGLALQAGPTNVSVSWTPVSGATSYALRRSTNQTTWTVVSSAITQSPYVDSNLTQQTTYYYQVQASNTSGSSNWSASVSATTLTLPVGNHSYYNTLIALPQHLQNWSLRDNNQIIAISNASGVDLPPGTDHPAYTYRPAEDTYPYAQDACKVWRHWYEGATSGSLGGNQLSFSAPAAGGQSILITCDWWFGQEFIDNRGTHTNWKAFFFTGGGPLGSSGRFWTHNWSFSYTSSVASPHESPDGSKCAVNLLPYYTGMTIREPMTPTGQGALPAYGATFYPRRWVRYWFYIETGVPWDDARFDGWRAVTGADLSIAPTWQAWSCWVADEVTDPQRVFYRVPHCDIWLSAFRFEMNSSEGAGLPSGDYIGYTRNLVMLRNYPLSATTPESDTLIFQRPTVAG